MKYMAESWVLDLFFDCAARLASFPTLPASAAGSRGGAHLQCPNAPTVATVAAAVARGDLWTHAFPHNGQAELMSATMFLAAVNQSKATARANGGPALAPVFSQRDVPGLSRGVGSWAPRPDAWSLSIWSGYLLTFK